MPLTRNLARPYVTLSTSVLSLRFLAGMMRCRLRYSLMLMARLEAGFPLQSEIYKETPRTTPVRSFTSLSNLSELSYPPRMPPSTATLPKARSNSKTAVRGGAITSAFLLPSRPPRCCHRYSLNLTYAWQNVIISRFRCHSGLPLTFPASYARKGNPS